MPGKKRKTTGKAPAAHKKRSLPESNASDGPRKYRQWSEESMLGALKAVSEGTMGINRAAIEFGVPKTTLKDRVVAHGSKSGKKPYLTPGEEKELYDYLLLCASIGFPKTRDDVIGNETGDDEAGDESPDDSDEENNDECGLMDDGETHAGDDATQATFTPEQLELFSTRFDNGYVSLLCEF